MSGLVDTIMGQHTKTLAAIDRIKASTRMSDAEKNHRIAFYDDILRAIEKHGRRINLSLPYRVSPDG